MNRVPTFLELLGLSIAMEVALIALCSIATTQPLLPVPPDIPPSPTLGAPPPPGAVILFDGESMANWTQMDGSPAKWPVAEGAMTSRGGDIMSREHHKDVYLHLEWREPDMPEAAGQGKGNSGVMLQGRYEIQVLDCYRVENPGTGDCGAIYGQHAALVNAYRPPLEWQTFDVFFRAPRFDEAGQLLEHARFTVLQNGIVIQNNVQVTGTNYGPKDADLSTAGPLVLQDHGCPVEYRNIWLVHLPEKGNSQYAGKRLE
ncbi:MAG: 3-keto-disaccharide hydrolase [Candidatus Zipacnadales bacterium]